MSQRARHASVIPRIRSRRGLIIAAVVVQVLVLAVAWVVAFRYVRGQITLAVQDYIIEENAEFAERLKDRLLAETGDPGEFGSAGWDQWQRVIEQAGADLPGGGFACLLDADGNVLCHPDIRNDQSLRSVNLGGKVIEAVDGGGKGTRVDTVSAGTTASGRVEFLADGTHYVATRRVDGTDLRLLVHQPEADLFGTSREITGPVIYSGVAAVFAVVMVGGLGLFLIVRSYDSTYAELNQRLKDNLAIARQLQQATLPALLPKLKGFDLSAWNQPADETGGDTYDLIALRRAGGQYGLAQSGDPDALLVVLADATGHGIGAALAATGYHTATRMSVSQADRLGVLAGTVNAQLHADLPTGRFVTSWFGLLQAGQGDVATYSAGQGPVLHYRAADHTVAQRDTDSWPLGVSPDLASSEPARLELAPGDILLVISDGLFEAANPAGEQFGTDRLAQTLQAAAGQSAADILAALNTAIDRFTHNAPPDDDRTAVVVKFVG